MAYKKPYLVKRDRRFGKWFVENTANKTKFFGFRNFRDALNFRELMVEISVMPKDNFQKSVNLDIDSLFGLSR